MSKAYKCERCGTFCEGVSKTRVALTGNSGIFDINSDIDLCPRCFDELKKWLKPEKPIKDGELCRRCANNSDRLCSSDEILHDCSKCHMKGKVDSLGHFCKCLHIRDGEPCPYFEEAKE